MKTLTICRNAKYSPDRGRYYCKETGKACMFSIPDSEACAKIYFLGPDAKKSGCGSDACTIDRSKE